MAEKETKRGGKRPGAGRPKKADAKTSVFSVAVTADELELLRSADARSWSRELLLRAARRKTD